MRLASTPLTAICCLHYISVALLEQTLGSLDEAVTGALLWRWSECLSFGGCLAMRLC